MSAYLHGYEIGSIEGETLGLLKGKKKLEQARREAAEWRVLAGKREHDLDKLTLDLAGQVAKIVALETLQAHLLEALAQVDPINALTALEYRQQILRTVERDALKKMCANNARLRDIKARVS